jgi:hypothetical protein
MIIHNGDHAQFEIDNAGVPPKERSDWPPTVIRCHGLG